MLSSRSAFLACHVLHVLLYILYFLVDWRDLGKLTYLNAVIKESMRCLPVAANGSGRTATDDVYLGKYFIPKGTEVVINLFQFMNSPLNWGEDAGLFRPERFLEEGAELWAGRPGSAKPQEAAPEEAAEAVPAAPPQGGGEGEASSGFEEELSFWKSGTEEEPFRPVKRFIPFAEGARSCAGMSLAKINVAATLATLLGNFTFTLADEMGGPEGVQASEHMAITLSCRKGMKMHCHARVPLEALAS
eukprot:jgi/Botrbrau1/3391/Bobra.0337s0032.1